MARLVPAIHVFFLVVAVKTWMPRTSLDKPGHDEGIQCFVTTLHLVTTASLICPASCAQAISPTFTEISLPIKPFSCAASASLLVISWNVSGPVSRLHSPFGGGSRRGSLVS